MVDVFGHIGMGRNVGLTWGLHVQPSELIKIALVMAMARFYNYYIYIFILLRGFIISLFILLPMVLVCVSQIWELPLFCWLWLSYTFYSRRTLSIFYGWWGRVLSRADFVESIA